LTLSGSRQSVDIDTEVLPTLTYASTNRYVEGVMRRISKSVATLAAVTLTFTSLAVLSGASPAAAATCVGTAPSDFNGDGISDAAIGEYFFNSTRAGVVHVIYGTRDGLSANASGSALDDQILTNTADTTTGFGHALATGDINGDGCSDLIIGDATATSGSATNVGAIFVYLGSTTGLQLAEKITASELPNGDSAANDLFGWALATGDFNHDGLADIAVGAPGFDLGGAVFVLPGHATESPIYGAHEFEQGDGTITGVNENLNEMGSALATGDVNGDNITDLAIGDPGENDSAGAVFVVRGSGTASLLTPTGHQTWTQNSTGVIGTAESHDDFGSALAMGNFAGTGRSDLAIGVPGEMVDGVYGAGFVNVLYSAGSGGLSSTGNQGWSLSSNGIPGLGAGQSSWFGLALTAGDFNGDGRSDLAVGAPGVKVGSASSAGSVTVLLSAPGALSVTGSEMWTENSAGIDGTPGGGYRFGQALTSLRVTSASYDDLLLGTPAATVSGQQVAGSAELIPGSSGGGLTSLGSQFWTTASPGIQGSPCLQCGFGGAVG
jgi:FG-GAP repeat